MSEEEKEAIEIVDNKIWGLMNTVCGNCIIEEYERDNYQEAIEIVLNMLKKKDKEVHCLEQEKQDAWEEWNNLEQSSYEEEKKLKAEIEEKEKIIEAMAGYIAMGDIEEDICQHVKNDNCDKMNFGECESCIIQYFERKVKDVKNKR